MSTSPFTYRRRLGRCPSPPTWAWYEQIPFPEDDSDNTDSCDDEDSCSEDDDSYERGDDAGDRPASPSESGSEGLHPSEGGADAHGPADQVVDSEMSEKVQNEGSGQPNAGTDIEVKKDIKGKQRAVDPPPPPEGDESPKRRERRKKHREPVLKFRPILTIQRSHGFVWNQVSRNDAATAHELIIVS